jgi:pyruvate formate lyase activating enzyme
MAICSLCGSSSATVSKTLRVCLNCIREYPEQALALTDPAHKTARTAFGLPDKPPRDPNGIPCSLCVNECRIPDGGIGYCGLRRNVGGRLEGVSSDQGRLSWYHDPLPTNCVADWVCPGGTGSGYPRWAYRHGPERGYANLAVFFQACSFDCLYCQNWHYREQSLSAPLRSAESLAAGVDSRTSCICFFGGDPAPQLPFSLHAARLARERNDGRILRICWDSIPLSCFSTCRRPRRSRRRPAWRLRKLRVCRGSASATATCWCKRAEGGNYGDTPIISRETFSF